AFAYKQIKQKGEGFTVDDMVVQVRLPDGSLFPNSGKIDFIGAEIDPTTDTAVVRGVLPNPVDADGAHALLPGQYVPVELTIGAIPDAVVVPTKAVVETQEGDFLYVIGQDNKVEYRKVKLGYSHNNLRVVEEGLKKGEKIVLDGLQKVKGGMTVKVTEAAAPTATATKPAEASSETPAKKDDKKAADEQ
ncbi:MAG TPA: efflux RND transporter periplasmic adaptor subunit, partial [Kiloniellaceae bacterium]|nr:efflux RND transporter periplasmic adaptor subunit [Kiloniellaceae bacterium]